MDLSTELEGLFGANIPLQHFVTYEEQRVIQAILELKPAATLGVYTWDIADGFTTLRESSQPFAKKESNTDTVLKHIAENAPANAIFIMKDFHHSWTAKKSYVTRKLRNMAPALRARNQFLVFTTPVRDLPIELKDDVVTVDIPLPDAPALTRLFDESTKNLDCSAIPRVELRDKIISSAVGLTTNQARLAFSRVWATHHRFDEKGIDIIIDLKKQVIRESGALEFWPAEEGIGSVGGLDLMKAWLTTIEKAFSAEAATAGVPKPRGVALIGIPGTGKSLSAKMLAGMWKLPLLRLDVGAIFGSLLGESEENIRKATRLADTVSPCILWIDEMEKAFAGAGAGAGMLTSGSSTRVFGSFLTWMQEHQSPVFVLATANDISALPIELMGRFDRTFFLDLPNAAERREIFTIHLKRAGVPFPDKPPLRMNDLVEQTRGWVGREIERVVREAQFIAFADGNREIEQDDLQRVIQQIIPLEKSHKDTIDALRKWKTEGHAFPASSEEKAAAPGRGRMLETS
jgi:hypothetical protein